MDPTLTCKVFDAIRELSTFSHSCKNSTINHGRKCLYSENMTFVELKATVLFLIHEKVMQNLPEEKKRTLFGKQNSFSLSTSMVHST